MQDKNLGKEGLNTLSTKMAAFAEDARLLDPIRDLFKKTNKYLMGYLTILDFAYADKAFYGLNFVGK